VLAAFALLAGFVAAPSPARATIVWEGREVPAWPDLPESSAAGFVGRHLASAPSGINLFPHPSGVVRGLTILVDFSDRASAYSKEEIDAWLNQIGYSKFGLKGSIRDYFLKQSSGKVDYQNEVVGFYRAKNTRVYYDGGSGYQRSDELWAEVVAALDATIDFSTFDNDKDGRTDAISILYAGGEGTFAQGLWPHASGSNVMKDGVRLNRYMMTALNNQPTNYVFAHESGHMLFGWPDLYGVGDFCIMANRISDAAPVGINDVFRLDQGWIDVVDIVSATNARLSSMPDGAAYRYVNPDRPTEYFAWSNVQNIDEWAPLKGGGLLVWHFDRSIGSNSPPATLGLAVVQGGGTRKLSGTMWPSPGSAPTDFFNRTVNMELGAATTPNSKWNDGTASGLRIYDISASGPTMQFSVGTGMLPPDGGSGGAGSTGGAAGSGGQPGAGGRQGIGGSQGAGGSATGSGGRPGAGGGDAGASGSGGQGAGGTGGRPGSGTGGALSGTGGAMSATGGAFGGAGAGRANGGQGGGPSITGDSGGCACAVEHEDASRAGGIVLLVFALALSLRRRPRN
jgi:M6 family metalloprotease-like protein/MYXO-CTERM domain-containing protein